MIYKLSIKLHQIKNIQNKMPYTNNILTKKGRKRVMNPNDNKVLKPYFL